MKKYLLVLLCICLVLSVGQLVPFSYADDSNLNEEFILSTTGIKEDNSLTLNQKKDLQECYDNATKMLAQFYYSRQKALKTDFRDYILYDSLNEYLQKDLLKSCSIRDLSLTNRFWKSLIAESFSAEFSMIDYAFEDEGISLKIYVRTKMQYPNMETKSEFGDKVELLMWKTEDTYKVADIIFDDIITDSPSRMSLNTWDIRKNRLNIRKRIDQLNYEIEDTYTTIREIDRKGAEALLKNDDVSLGQLQAPGILKATATTYSFNRSEMKKYAKRTAPLLKDTSDNKLYKSDHTSARGSSQAPYYYDFSSFTGSYDCTNFVSHVLLAGGAKMKDNQNPSTGWYFHNMNPSGATSRSYTWSSVTSLGDFLISNTGKGPKGNLVSYFNSNSVGDIIQFKYSDYNPTGYGHSTVITLAPYADFLSNYNPSEIGPIVNAGITSRSTNGGYRVDQNLYRKLCNLDGGNHVVGYRSIHLTGYSY